jgi:hypothetical protein
MSNDIADNTVPPVAGTTPAAATVTPPQATPPAAGTGDIKVDAAAEVERLKNEVNKKDTITRTAQSEAAQAKAAARAEKAARIKAEKDLKAALSGATVVPPVDTSNSNATEREVQLGAQMMIKDLLIENPQYRELVDNDPTLKEVIKNNPFVLIGDYFDANDAVEQFKEKLDGILRSKTQPKKEVATTEPPVIEPKVIQPTSGVVPPATKLPQNTGDKIADSIASKVKFT